MVYKYTGISGFIGKVTSLSYWGGNSFSILNVKHLHKEFIAINSYDEKITIIEVISKLFL